MKKVFILTFMLLSAVLASAQQKEQSQQQDQSGEAKEDGYFVTHKVTPGEQIIMISKKYLVDPQDIYKYNKGAVDGISAGTTLMIPLHKSHKKDIPAFIKTLEKENLAKAGTIRAGGKG
jgi:LysM repeat protein